MSRTTEAAAGTAAAYALFAATFRGPREQFWQRMTLTGATLGTLALATTPPLRRIRLRRLDVPVGIGSAAVLYGVFLVGDRVARRIMPAGAADIAEVYALRSLRPAGEIALRLAAVIGPAEELFWRGYLQTRLASRLGRWRGAAVATAAYGGAHLVTGNPTLLGAASVAGAFWGGLSAAGVPMGALIVSHLSWDVVTLLIAPTTPRSAA